MPSLRDEFIFLILQFLKEEMFTESLHKLEKESRLFFNLKYFGEKVLVGDWDEVEDYVSSFTKLHDNAYSLRIFFVIRKQKYLEALDRRDRAKAVEILVKDLKVFSSFDKEMYEEITQLLTIDNFRLNWQHVLCENPRPKPDIKTLFTDHTCAPTNGARAPSVYVPLSAVTKPATYAPFRAHGPFPPAAPAAANSNALAGWMANAAASSSASPISFPSNQGWNC